MIDGDISYFYQNYKEDHFPITSCEIQPQTIDTEIYDDVEIEIPKEIKKYFTNEYLTNRSKCKIAIRKIINMMTLLQFPFPPKSIKNIIFILENADDLKMNFIEEVLFLLDIALNSFTSYLEFTAAEISIIINYFPNNYAINILSHAIRLDPKCTKLILESFLPKKRYEGFVTSIILLIQHDYTNNIYPILNLIFTLSDKFEIVKYLTTIFQSLLPIVNKLSVPEKKIYFKILENVCKQDYKYINILYNNDYIQYLYSSVTNDDELLIAAFKFLLFISSDCEGSLRLIKRLKIKSSVKYAIENAKDEAIRIISTTFYNIFIDDNEAVNYFLQKQYLNLFLSLQTKISFSTWQEVMAMICVLVYSSNNAQQIEYMLQNSNILQCISDISENIDSNTDYSQEYLSLSIVYAFKNLYEIAKIEYERNNRKILSQELRNHLVESSLLETGYDYHPVTDFIQSIDHLYSRI